jgi:hypothetical protein
VQTPKVTETHRLSPYVQPDVDIKGSVLSGLVRASLLAVPIFPQGDEKR